MPRPLWTVWSTRPSGCNPAQPQPTRTVGSYVLSWPRDEWEQVDLASLECWLPCPPCFRVWLGYRSISFVLCLEAKWQRCGVRGSSGQLCVQILFLWMRLLLPCTARFVWQGYRSMCRLGYPRYPRKFLCCCRVSRFQTATNLCEGGKNCPAWALQALLPSHPCSKRIATLMSWRYIVCMRAAATLCACPVVPQ